MDEIRDMDFGGIFLYVAGFFLFLLGLAWGGTVHPWTSSYVLAPLIVGFFTFVGFIVYGESSVAANQCDHFKKMVTDLVYTQRIS